LGSYDRGRRSTLANKDYCQRHKNSGFANKTQPMKNSGAITEFSSKFFYVGIACPPHKRSNNGICIIFRLLVGKSADLRKAENSPIVTIITIQEFTQIESLRTNHRIARQAVPSYFRGPFPDLGSGEVRAQIRLVRARLRVLPGGLGLRVDVSTFSPGTFIQLSLFLFDLCAVESCFDAYALRVGWLLRIKSGFETRRRSWDSLAYHRRENKNCRTATVSQPTAQCLS
jgi:hypothetical protein